MTRTPEQQRKDMFKTMDEANKNREQYDPVFEKSKMTNYYLITVVNQNCDYKHSSFKNVLTKEEPEDIILSLNKYKDSNVVRCCIVNVLKITEEKYNKLWDNQCRGML